MEFLYFTLVAIILYLGANWILEHIESAAGRRLPQRTLIFFFILLVLALASFALIRRLAGS